MTPKLDIETFEPILDNGAFVMVEGKDEVIQDLTVALRVFLKEWQFDESVGLDWLGRVFWDHPQALRDAEIKRAILAVDDVISISSFATRENLDETITIEFSVLTTFGIASIGSADIVSMSYYDEVPFVAGPAVNIPPTALVSASGNNLTLSIDATSSSDIDGFIVSTLIEWGDGSTNSSASASHTYAAAGSYGYTVTVTDDDGATHVYSGTFTATEPNVPPVSGFTASGSYLTLSVDASASYDTDGNIVSYLWDWGDGSYGSGAVTSKTYVAEGIYNFSLTTMDNDGATNTSSGSYNAVAEPANAPPVSSLSYTIVGSVLSVDGTGSSDSDGSIVLYTWSWGDGSTNTTGSTASHTYVDGTYTFTLTTEDDDGATHTISQAIVIDTAPAAIPEPSLSVSPYSSFRFFEASDVGGLVDTVNEYTNIHGDLTASGLDRPDKIATGVGSVYFDGVNDHMEASSLSEYSFMTNGGDFMLCFTFKALSAYLSGSHTIFGISSAAYGWRIIISYGTMRLYAYGSGSDYTSIGNITYDDTWTTVTLHFDASAKDLFKGAGGSAPVVDGNFQFGQQAGDHLSPLKFGEHPVATSSKYELEIRHACLFDNLGDTVNDGPDYHSWASSNGLLT